MTEREYVARLIAAANAKLDVLDRALTRADDPTELAGLIMARRVILTERAQCEQAAERIERGLSAVV